MNAEDFAARISGQLGLTGHMEVAFMIEALRDVVTRARTVDPTDPRACWQLLTDYECAWAPDEAPSPQMTAARAQTAIDFLMRKYPPRAQSIKAACLRGGHRNYLHEISCP